MGRSSSAPSIARAVDLGPAPGDGHQRYHTHRGAEEDRPVAEEKQRDREERLFLIPYQIIRFLFLAYFPKRICMYVCMYVCMHVCIYLFTMCQCVYVCMYVCKYE